MTPRTWRASLTIRGVIAISSSVRAIVSSLDLNRLPNSGMSPARGVFVARVRRLVLLQARQHDALTVVHRDVVRTRRCWMVGLSMPEVVVVVTSLTSCSMSSTTRFWSLMRGVMFSTMPVLL